ncbi:MAG: ATP-binding protein [Verrucomicrobiota bacterium]
MENQPLILWVKNSLEEIPGANKAASVWLADRNAPPSIDYLANLAIEELLTNCIKYGYDDAGEHLVQISLRMADNQLELTVTDDGHAFNPLDLPPPNTNLPVADMPIGGLGIHLLRQMSNRMEYRRIDGKNQLTLWKR